MKQQQKVYLTHPKMPALVHGILNMPRPSSLGGGLIGLFLLTWVSLWAQVAPAATVWTFPAGSVTGDPIPPTNKFPDSDALDLINTDFTVSACVFQTRRNGGYSSAILTKRNSANGWGLFLEGNSAGGSGAIRTGAVKFIAAHDNVGSRVISSQSLSLSTTYHVAVVSKAGQAQIFINGAPDGTSALAPPKPSKALLRIGSDVDSKGQPQYLWHGTLSNLQIDNTALSQAEIQTLCASCGGVSCGTSIIDDNQNPCNSPFGCDDGSQINTDPESSPTYNSTTGELYIPQLSINGSTQTCEVYLQQQPRSLNFLLDAHRAKCQ